MAIFRSKHWRAWWPRLLFLASGAILAAGTAGAVPLPLMRSLPEYNFFDLRIYRAATHVVSLGVPLYSAHLRHGLGFTYPPFAVIAMMPLRWLSLFHAEEAVTLGNIVLVAVVAHAAVRMRKPSPNNARAGWIAAAIALWAEPITSAIGYGQIDLLISALVTVDLAYGSRSRAGGIGIGLAAALKLTPLIFIPYLLLSRRRHVAGRAAATFAFSIVIAFIALPKDAVKYWGGTVFDVSRVTGRHHLSGSSPVNQSLRGALVRLFPGITHISVVWLPACLLVACMGLLLAALAARRGDEAGGFMLTAVTGLLISPISWTHHWALVVPAAIASATTLSNPSTRRMLTLLAAEITLASSAIWLVIDLDPVGTRLGVGGQLLGDLYVLAALGTLTVAAGGELRRATGLRRAPARRSVAQQRLRVIPEPVSGP